MRKNTLKFLLFAFLILKITSCTDESAKNDKKSVLSMKTAYGDINILLFKELAPNTVEHISKLIKKNYYQGITFHKTSDAFLQTGDPTNIGTGKSGNYIRLEQSSLKHELGTVSLARDLNDITSGDSQFFISLKENKHFDGKYTIFGKVISDLNILKKIKKGDRIILLKLKSF